MDTSLIRKVQKARQYAEQPDRFTFASFDVQFHGSHREHKLAYRGTSGFSCDCEYFTTHGSCSHTMAVERVLNPMLPAG